MKPVRIRPYTPADLEACRQLYKLNEPGRFPAGVLPEFEEVLQSERALFLIAENNGVVCGCGGIRVAPEPHHQASLFFGLVHPQSHGRGLGTTLLLARLALLSRNSWVVTMLPMPASEGFYRRFNFREYGLWNHPAGGPMMIHYVRVSPNAVNRCATLLAKAGVALDGDIRIPNGVPVTA